MKGYCTRNEKGMFEVSWSKEKTFWTKLFNLQTEFKFMTKGLDNINYVNLGKCYHHFPWEDTKGYKVDSKTRAKINKILTSLTQYDSSY